MSTITWSASNNSSFLNGDREAKSIIGAVRAARSYVRNELGGEGKITIYENGVEIRQDRCDIFTNFQWETTDLFR